MWYWFLSDALEVIEEGSLISPQPQIVTLYNKALRNQVFLSQEKCICNKDWGRPKYPIK